MDAELLTGAGGALGVAAWVIWWQSRLIERLREDHRALLESCRADQQLVYDRLLKVVGDLHGALTALELAVIKLGRSRDGDGNNAQS